MDVAWGDRRHVLCRCRILQNCHDDAAKFVHLLMNPGCNYLVQEDFVPFLQVRPRLRLVHLLPSSRLCPCLRAACQLRDGAPFPQGSAFHTHGSGTRPFEPASLAGPRVARAVRACVSGGAVEGGVRPLAGSPAA